jgi:hypothetical protein
LATMGSMFVWVAQELTHSQLVRVKLNNPSLILN